MRFKVGDLAFIAFDVNGNGFEGTVGTIICIKPGGCLGASDGVIRWPDYLLDDGSKTPVAVMEYELRPVRADPAEVAKLRESIEALRDEVML
jgi:hypothetical protein